MIIYRN